MELNMNVVRELDNIFEKYNILDKNNFLGFRENMKKFVLDLNEKDLKKEYLRRELFHDLVEYQKDIGYEVDMFNEYIMAKTQNDKNLGQHFTPKCLNRLMSKMLKFQKNKIIIFYDPAGGTGSTMFAAIKEYQLKSGFTEWNNCLVIHQDMDIINCTLATLNYSMRGINSLVICGDTLHNEINLAFQTINYDLGFGFSHISVFDKEEELKRVYRLIIEDLEVCNG